MRSPETTKTFDCMQRLFSTLVLFLIIFLALAPVQSALAQPPRPDDEPSMPLITDRLDPPLMPESPTQADYGAEVFYLVCMVCHGDKGQGLTQEWRDVLGPPDNNCWQSGCHGKRHPPEGFELPRYAPSVIGPATVARFETALDLYQFLADKMPWQKPGMLKEEEYWQLTAFLVRENGVDLGGTVLDEERAASIRLRPAVPDQEAASPVRKFFWIGGGAILLLAALFLVVKFFPKRDA